MNKVYVVMKYNLETKETNIFAVYKKQSTAMESCKDLSTPELDNTVYTVVPADYFDL